MAIKQRPALSIRALALIVALCTARLALAEPPEMIRLQGALAHLGGAAVTDGNYEFLVEIFEVATGGAPLFSTSVISAVAAGAYSLPITPIIPGELGDALAGDGARFVQITVIRKVGGITFNEILLPRQQLASVPYALDAPQLDTGFSTGDVKLTFKTVADPGWALLNDGAIGNASSNASSDPSALASDETHDLFVLLWENVQTLAVQDAAGNTVNRGASAENDWNANRRLILPKALGRALAVAGAGAGLTSRALGETLGEESHVLVEAEMPRHKHQMMQGSSGLSGSGGSNVPHSSATSPLFTSEVGSNAPHNNMQPTLFLNVMIKL